MPYIENSQKNLPSQKIHNYNKIFKVLGVSKMKDLSKAERLEKEILEMAEKCGDKKWWRVKRTFFVISGVIYLIELCCALSGGISDINIDTICGLLLAPPFAAGFIMFISYGVLYYIIDGSMKEENAIAKLEGELNAIKLSKNDYEDENIKEIKNILEDLRITLKPILEEHHIQKIKERLDKEANKNKKERP